MTGDVKNNQQVSLFFTLAEWSTVHAAVQEAWSRAVKLDEKARKANFEIKEQTEASAEKLGKLLEKIGEVVAK